MHQAPALILQTALELRFITRQPAGKWQGWVEACLTPKGSSHDAAVACLPAHTALKPARV